jgi:hypothetical protein
MQTARTRRDFRIGLSVGCLFASGLNLLPYLRTRGAYKADGLEIIGFPFVFRSLGGFAYRFYFHWWALVADALLAAIFAFVLGVAWSKIRSGRPVDL